MGAISDTKKDLKRYHNKIMPIIYNILEPKRLINIGLYFLAFILIAELFKKPEDYTRAVFYVLLMISSKISMILILMRENSF